MLTNRIACDKITLNQQENIMSTFNDESFMNNYDEPEQPFSALDAMDIIEQIS